MNSYNLCLNYVPLSQSDFTINCYRTLVVNEAEARPFQDVRRYWLPDGAENRDSGQKYWISLVPHEGWEQFTFNSVDNPHAALWVLNQVLLPDFERHVSTKFPNYDVECKSGLFPTLDVKLLRHDEGWQGICLELQWLKEKRQLGLLVNYKFFADRSKVFDRHKILELSFSMDENGRSNKNFAVDTFKWERAFLRKVLGPYEWAGSEVLPEKLRFASAFSILPAFTLASREYDFGNHGRHTSQYSGLLRYGPCELPPVMPKFFFVFRPQDRMAARTLYRALAGKTYPIRFPGMERVFNVPFSGDAVSSCEVNDFSYESLEKAAGIIHKSGGENPVCIVLSDDEVSAYYAQKALFLAQRIATQNVRLASVLQRRDFEWFIAGIALQIFCKSKGRPWKVRSRSERTLIVGVSQAIGHAEGGQHRYVSYSVTTDASGVFQDIQTLADERTEESYVEKLASNLETHLRNLASQKKGQVNRIVLHCSFRLSFQAMARLRTVAKQVAGMDDAPQIVILRLNTDHQYAGYDLTQAALVPRECSFVSLGGGKYILWCDGLKRNQSIQKRPCNPIQVNFDYAFPPLPPAEKMSILEDISNLAGANWRGFNASTRPVSVFYCRIVGEFIKEFSERGLPVPSVEEFMPWFL